ncbi:hypothetical protein NEOLEDRAFT_1150707 [Neolentinus lepideus HHB14362 ss-1]|uniref:Uncharacterized protein n=1 Tax=Neolentinus lepideus HHB14362 ss-1 TaxID=1314782 RepID=A0A165PR35_9AGAM|nr:hypothetical protein NEOLEDRAFT_1150707 [Neolentinus lepideus HHB14362 ss-1]
MSEEELPYFPNSFDVPAQDAITLVEYRMRVLIGEIIEKPNWWIKVCDNDIVGKWRAEFIEHDAERVRRFWPEDVNKQKEDINERMSSRLRRVPTREGRPWPRKVITDVQLDYIFDWLRWLADEREAKSGVEATHILNVYQSCKLIPAELREALIRGAAALETVPEAEKDWHPRSNRQVLDLVHPSLYCFRIGKSLAKNPETGSLHAPLIEQYIQQREDLKRFSYGWKPNSLSIQHQWLPTDFSVSETGSVASLSYINNLHPDDHKSLYQTISAVIERFVPLWERVLGDLHMRQEPLIVVDPYLWYDEGPRRATPEPQEEDFVDIYPEHEYTGRRAYWAACSIWEENNEPFVPEPQAFTPPERNVYTLRDRNIQVIVKMANIVLTPENPEYPGGSWHVEGMLNESIVATGIYYYDSANITESKLSFRQALDSDSSLSYQQGDTKGYLQVYGIDGNGGPLNQELGSVVTKEGKCLVFPNIWQHRVSPFRLVDPAKPGHRKILCFFLVDPTVTILSTSSVPPQQYEWYMREAERIPGMGTLPRELQDMVTDELRKDGAITLEQAKEEREKLMEERANFVVIQNKEVYELGFNMCEH